MYYVIVWLNICFYMTVCLALPTDSYWKIQNQMQAGPMPAFAPGKGKKKQTVSKSIFRQSANTTTCWQKLFT